jgi:hypothetical protein
MTIPYNAHTRSMKGYILANITTVNKDNPWDKDNKCKWYTASEEDISRQINDHDVPLLVDILRQYLFNDFAKMRKLKLYLLNIAGLFV